MAIKLITDTKLKKALSDCSVDDLTDLILELSAKIKPVKELLTVKFGETTSEKELCEKYKKVIENEFFPCRREPGRGNLKIAKAAIKDFRQVSVSRTSYVDILLFCVEQCVDYTNTYGDIDEPFYSSTERIFAQAVGEINQSGYELYDKFSERFRHVVEDTKGIGWGFADSMREKYNEIRFLESP
jgi:hypothetical protein